MNALEALSIAAGIVQLFGVSDKLSDLAPCFSREEVLVDASSQHLTAFCNLVCSLPELANALQKAKSFTASVNDESSDAAVCFYPRYQLYVTDTQRLC